MSKYVYSTWILPCLQTHIFSHLLKVKVKVAQSSLTLCDPVDDTVHGILQARILEWIAFPFSRGSSQPRDQNPGLLHCRILYHMSHKGSPLDLQLEVLYHLTFIQNQKWGPYHKIAQFVFLLISENGNALFPFTQTKYLKVTSDSPLPHPESKSSGILVATFKIDSRIQPRSIIRVDQSTIIFRLVYYGSLTCLPAFIFAPCYGCYQQDSQSRPAKLGTDYFEISQWLLISFRI